MNELLYTTRRGAAALGGYGIAARAALAHRAHFFLQMLFMALNDVVWLVFWLLLFRTTSDVRGWEVDEFLVLFAVVTASAGTAWGVFAGVRDTPYVLASGELDALLTQPAPVLARLMARRLDVPLVGDVAFGFVIFAFSGFGDTIGGWLLYVGASMLGAAVTLAFLVAAHSLTFWLGGRGEPGQLAANASLVFSMYPLSIFGGGMKLVLYTVIPTAFMATLPATLVIDFDPATLAQVAAAALVLSMIAGVLWSSGLRHYRRHSL